MAAAIEDESGGGDCISTEGIMAEQKKEQPVYNWKDITEEFVEAAGDLQLGELLHDTSFGLFEAMSAIEMMDPKMDAGMLCNQIRRKVMNLETAVETGNVKIKGLTYQELIGIMDATLSCVVTWLEGHALAQTVFTNLYLHNPYMIEDRCLKAFSVGLLKIVDVIRDRINRAGVFEEEDFQPMTYGFKMAGDITDVRALGMMKEVEEEVNRAVRNAKSKLQSQTESNSSDWLEEHEMALGVSIRMKFYRLLLSMLLALGKEKCEGIPQAQKLIVQLKDMCPQMRASICWGIKPEGSEVTKNDYPTIMGFEPLINQRLLPPTFPRYTVICGRDSAVTYIEALLHRLDVATTILDTNNLQTVLEVFKEFSKSSPCVLSRSMLQLIFLPPNRKVFGSQQMTEFIKDSIRAFVSPPALSPKSPLYNTVETKQYIDALMTRAVRPMCNLLQITGHNRARQRDKWAHILDELISLQEEADKVDAYLHSLQTKNEPGRQHAASFGCWVLYYLLHSMISYTLAGFELELYAAYEYHYLYWYLCELLCSWLVSTLQRAESFYMEHEAYIDHLTKGRNNKKSKKKKRSKSMARELALTQAQQYMFGGYHKAVMGLKMSGKMREPDFDFDSEEVRYSHRFGPFVNISTPPMVHYAQYKEMSSMSRYDTATTPEDLYGTACKLFHQAKTLYESISSPSEEVQGIIRIAKTNFVMMKLLSGGHKKDSMVPPDFDFSINKIYPIIKL